MDSRNNNNPSFRGRKIRRCLRRRRNNQSNRVVSQQATNPTTPVVAANAQTNDLLTSNDPIIVPLNSNAQQTTIRIESKISQPSSVPSQGYSVLEDEQATTGAPSGQVPISDSSSSLVARNPTATQAARILFREFQPTQQVPSARDQLVTSTTGCPSIVNANRRLIERHIEAIQEANSRRWNFNFTSGTPLFQPGHRYINYTQTTLRNCRPLIDQNQSSPSQFDQLHQQLWKPNDPQNRSDHKQDDV